MWLGTWAYYSDNQSKTTEPRCSLLPAPSTCATLVTYQSPLPWGYPATRIALGSTEVPGIKQDHGQE